MDSFGSYLKNEREKRGITLKEVSKATNITVHILEAIEANRIKELPAHVFVKGFINNYAKFLGLDPKETLERYLDFLSESSEFDQEILLKNERYQVGKIGFDQIKILVRVKNIHRKRIFYLIFFVLLISIIFFISKSLFFKNKSSPLDKFPHIKYPPSFEISPSQKEGTNTDKTSNIIKQSNNSIINKMAETESQKPDKAKLHGSKTAQEKEIAKNLNNEELQKRRQLQDEDHKKELVISAVDTTWMDIKIDDYPSYDLTLEPGNTILLEAEKSFSLLIGNAAGIKIVFEGQDIGSLGKEGDVVRLQLP